MATSHSLRMADGLCRSVGLSRDPSDLASQGGLQGDLDHLVVDSSPVPRPWVDVVEPWQREFYGLLQQLFERAAGMGSMEGPRCLYATLPRGHAKTSGVAQLVSWAITYGKRHVEVVAAASDRDQAALLAQRIDRETACNPWLAAKIKRHNYHVNGVKGHVRILSSDAPSASGQHPDIIVCDEITWWKDRTLFDMLFSGRNKKPHLAFIVLTNAGIIGTWQYDIWKQAQEDKENWLTYETSGSVASWLNPKAIEADRKLLPPSLAKRLYDNLWQTEAGEFVTREQIEACIDPNWAEQHRYQSRFDYVLGMDWGSKKDRATACVTHLEEKTQTVVLDKMWIHQGTPDSPTPIELMDSWGNEAYRDFRITDFVCDPMQIQVIVQKMSARGVRVREEPMGWASLHKLSMNLRSLIVTGKLRLYAKAGFLTLPDGTLEDLVDEMAKLVVEETQAGRWRFQHLPNKHDDRTMSLALSCLGAVRGETPSVPRVVVVGVDGVLS